MIIPIRCFTCGKTIAHKWGVYNDAVTNGVDPGVVLTYLGFERYCCRRMFMTHVDMMGSDVSRDEQPSVDHRVKKQKS